MNTWRRIRRNRESQATAKKKKEGRTCCQKQQLARLHSVANSKDLGDLLSVIQGLSLCGSQDPEHQDLLGM